MSTRPQPPQIRAGDLRCRITIMQPSTERDGAGELLAPVEFAKRWASIDPMSGQQYYRAQQFVSDANYEVGMRYLKGVLPKMTVRFGNRMFEILYAIDEQERKIKTTLYCREVL
jgi:SPP1 family predicted phage head-tail adaptor